MRMSEILKRMVIVFFALVTIQITGYSLSNISSLQPLFAQTYTQVRDWINSYSDEDKFKVLGDIQPGTGVLMQELARRFTALFYAARGGNWDLANYQLKEMREVIDINVVTRPTRKDALESFESSSLGSEENPAAGTLQDAINKKSFLAFKQTFKSAIDGCNGCHQATGFSFIKYKLPPKSELPLQFIQTTENSKKE